LSVRDGHGLLNRLPLGKLPTRVLERTVMRMTGAESDLVLTGPELGVDFGVIKLEDRFMIVSSDPITGVTSRIGWYAVNVNANDVATSGNRPQFMESIIMLPEGSVEKDVAVMAKEIHQSARGLGMSVMGGHTEVTPGLQRPIVVVTAFSFVRKYVTSAGAKDGDVILMTKSAGLEGTSILVSESARLGISMDPSLMRGARRMERQLSIVREAVSAYRTGAVHAMHDCTEGGVLGAVYEMSLASRVGFQVYEKDVPVAAETKKISRALKLDPLRLISSGSLLLAVQEGEEEKVKHALSRISAVVEIGRFQKGRRVLSRHGGSELNVTRAPVDELWRALGRLEH
jgi:hydrogenase expression/formation protein HypE